MTTWKCTSCGAIDSRICNGDNACCSECGDPEGLEEVSDRMFDGVTLEDVAIDPDRIKSPSIADVGFWHWLAHKFGWNHGQIVVVWDDGRLMVGFRCETCGYIGGYHKAPSDHITTEPFFSHKRTNWPEEEL